MAAFDIISAVSQRRAGRGWLNAVFESIIAREQLASVVSAELQIGGVGHAELVALETSK